MRETYMPLTPELRRGVVDSLDDRLRQLNSCNDTPYVNMYRCAYGAMKSLITALPDGYPVPITRK